MSHDKANAPQLIFSNKKSTNPKPIVTIGMCVKDCETSVKEAMNSVYNQDFDHKLMELIVIDDGSEDRTLSIVLDIVSGIDLSVKVFRSKWRGLGPARNVVVGNARGDYIVWLDGDMVLPRDHVRKQVEFMERNPAVGIAKAKHGIYPGENLIAALEHISYVAMDSKYGGKATSKLPGTGGSIYRVRAIKEVRGFDERLTGVGEDVEAANRIIEAGWMVYLRSPALFYERRKQTWKDLWNQYFWYGYGGYNVIRKKSGVVDFYKMGPLTGFIVGVWYSLVAYKLIHRKWVFLLPFHFVFKMTAWCLGFARGQIDSHE